MMRATHCCKLLLLLAACACNTAQSGDDIADNERMTKTAPPPELAPWQPTPIPSADGNVAHASAVDKALPSYHNILNGAVDGTQLNPMYAFFLQGIMTLGDAQPTLVFVQTDAPNLCQHMQRGTMPKNTNIFAAALVQTDGQPVQVGYSYTAPGHHGMDQDPRSIAFFRRISATCEVSPNEVGAEAMYGQAIVRQWVPGQHVVVDYAFDFEDLGSITGHAEAPFCDAPEFFINPEQFYQPIEPDKCLDD